jgi:hypothetical protein
MSFFHLDVSENNIIVTEAATEREPKGMLIDLDLAKELDSVPSGYSAKLTSQPQSPFVVLYFLSQSAPTWTRSRPTSLFSRRARLRGRWFRGRDVACTK